MEKLSLMILVVDRISESEKFFPKRVSDVFGSSGYDIIFIPHENENESKYRVQVFVMNTSSIRSKHDGQWRTIFLLQGKNYEDKKSKLTYFDIPDRKMNSLFDDLRRYFDLDIKKISDTYY